MSGAPPDPRGEDPAYLTRQLLTYLGNKRALLGPIAAALERVCARLGKDRLRTADLFAGSGVVSRRLAAYSEHLVSNDLEPYAAVVARSFLRRHDASEQARLQSIVDEFERRVETEPLAAGFIRQMYAPEDEAHICPGERVFYTPENARRLDDHRRRLAELDASDRDALLGPLLSKASIHANTAGVFKGFYKDRATGLGRFGGTGADALARIRGLIRLEVPVASRQIGSVEVRTEDANRLAPQLKALDLVYLDPPYNQHPYGSNYFMLNLLASYVRPEEVSRVSGIPKDWRRSGYNVRRRSVELFERLLDTLDASHVLISFSNEGFISEARMRKLLEVRGRLEVLRVTHPVFRGSRSFEGRPTQLTESLYLLER